MSSAPGNRFHQDYIRVIPPGQTDLICPSAFQSADALLRPWQQETSYEYVWNSLPTLNRTFDRFRASGETGVNRTYADLITPIIKVRIGNTKPLFTRASPHPARVPPATGSHP